MTPDEILDAIDLVVDCCDGAECSDDDVDRLCGYVVLMAKEIRRLQALLPPSDDGETVTAEWLESVGLRGVLIDQDDVTVEVHEYGSWVAGDCFCIDLKCQTRGDARRLAAVFGIKMRERAE